MNTYICLVRVVSPLYCRHEPRAPNEDQIVPESTIKTAPTVQDRPSVIQRHDSRTISDLERFLLNADREDHAAGIADSPLGETRFFHSSMFSLAEYLDVLKIESSRI